MILQPMAWNPFCIPDCSQLLFTGLPQPSNISKLVDNKTRAVFFETITNPMLEVADVKALSELSSENNIVLIADTTITPLYIFNSKDFGVDIEIISSTKYISGGATAVGGLIIDYGKFDWRKIDKLKREFKLSVFVNQMQHLIL